MLVNDKGTLMTCGLFIGVGETPVLPPNGTEIPYITTNISIHIIDLVAEVSLTYKFLNKGDLPIRPTFIFPLNNIGVLCEVEASVDAEKRIGSEIDLDVVKSILDHRETQGDIDFHVIKPGEVPPNTEVWIKCTFIVLTSINGDHIHFTLPASLLPPKPIDHTEPLHAVIALDMHDKVLGVTSQSHSDVSFMQFAGGKASADVKMGTDAPKDLMLQINVPNTQMPRAWTSVGKSGSLQSRMSMVVLCPPFREPEGSAKAGEVVLFVDIRGEESSQVEQIVNASLAKVPSWAHFNIWASFDGTSFSPVFETSMPANDGNFNNAIVKIKTLVSFTGDDASIPPIVQSLLNSQTSFYPRLFFFVTSMATHFDDALKIIAGSLASTRSVIISLKSKWNDHTFPDLFTSHGGSLLLSPPQDLATSLPSLIEQNAHKAQFLTFSAVPRPAHQYPLATPPHFHSSTYLNFLIHYDQLGTIGDIEVKGGGEEWNENDTITLRPKEVHTQAFHRLGTYYLLNEFKAGLRQDISPNQKDFLNTILYSTWSFHPITPKTPTSGNLSGFLSGLKPGIPRGGISGGKTLPARPVGLPPKKQSGSIRENALESYTRMKQQNEACPADNMDRAKVTIQELEPQALKFGYDFVKTNLSPLRQLTSADCSLIRSIILPLIQEPTSECLDQLTNSINATSLKSLVEKSLQEKWKAQDEDSWFEYSVKGEQGSRPYMEDQFTVIESADSFFGLPSQPKTAFFGIFDGHLGRRAAEFAKVNLPFNIFKNNNYDANKIMSDDNSNSNNNEGLKEIVKEGYLKTDNDFIDLAEKEGLKSGSTAVTLILIGNTIVVSNCGDSEAVLCKKNGTPVVLSTIHSPKNDEECKRIVSTGGSIMFFGTMRVNAILAVTRSFGDRTLKAQITALPDTVVQQLTPEDEFIILATDGLWEVLTKQEAVDFVKREREINNTPISSLSHKLVEEALRKESKDNVSAIVVFFKHS